MKKAVQFFVICLVLIQSAFASFVGRPDCQDLLQKVNERLETPIDYVALLQSLLLLKSTQNRFLLNPVLINAVEQSLGQVGILQNETALNSVLVDLFLQTPEPKRTLALGASLPAVANLLIAEQDEDSENDLFDINRGFGVRILLKHHAAFRDPQFLLRYLLTASAATTGEHQYDPSRGLQNAKKFFESQWERLAPKNVKPVTFTQTGSDANNLIYDYARALKGQEAQVLVFENSWAAGRGPLAGAHAMIPRLRKSGVDFSGLIIPSPTTTALEHENATTRGLTAAEKKSLEFIRTAVAKNKKRPIGAVLIEPILGAAGVLFYRPQFMKALRVLADELQIAIAADEILTGGGRTGKFFAYEHYKGFTPDLVTFGKGLVVSGIAEVARSNAIIKRTPFGTVTNEGSPQLFLIGGQVMKIIADENLMENATRVGAYLIEKLRTYEGPRFSITSSEVRGIGMLIQSNIMPLSLAEDASLNDNGVRFTPPLNLSTEDVDRWFYSPSR